MSRTGSTTEVRLSNREKGWANANLRKAFGEIVAKACLAPRSRLLHNLRASRQTELADRRPLRVVAKWLGNALPIATAW